MSEVCCLSGVVPLSGGSSRLISCVLAAFSYLTLKEASHPKVLGIFFSHNDEKSGGFFL